MILDVVFNHTAEGNEKGPTFCFKGFDNKIYYMLTPDGNYYNFSGCGNTLNCNHPMVRQMILECLQYWTINDRIDGFRFDLASILGRNADGSPMNNPPLLESLAFNPVLSNVKLIAEAWDAGGTIRSESFRQTGAGQSGTEDTGIVVQLPERRSLGGVDCGVVYIRIGRSVRRIHAGRQRTVCGLQFLCEFFDLSRWIHAVRSVFLQYETQ